VADGADGLAGLEELLDERDRVLILAQVVGVDGPAREDQPGVVLRRGVCHLLVDGELRCLLDVVVHRLDLARLQREQLGLPAGLLHGLLGLLVLDLLNAVRGQDRDRLSLQLIGHVCSFVPHLAAPAATAAALMG